MPAAATLTAAIEIEWLKLRRSRVAQAATMLLVPGIPTLTLAFMRAATTDKNTALSTKVHALMTGTGWSAYLGLANQIIPVALLLGVGITVGWCYGREFTDKTMVSLYALPVSRPTIAAAKAIVLTAWSVTVCLLMTVLLLACAPLAGTGPLDSPAMSAVGRTVVVELLTVLLALPLALPASTGRGYLAAIGALLLLIIATQVLAALGTGAWFPYAAPGLWAQKATEGQVNAIQLALVPITTFLTLAITLQWWRRADIT